MPESPDDLEHSLVPLTVAVKLIHEKAYAPARMDELKGTLDGLASTVAARIPIYEYDADPKKGVRLLSSADLSGGMFRHGGRELESIDGRAIRRCLAVAAADIPSVIKKLEDALAQDNRRRDGPLDALEDST
jgi:hypothetical protein